jgi:glycerol-3-phosphate acyltransferase PlsY
MRAESAARDLAAVALAFGAGCLPSAQIVTRLARGSAIEDLGDGKPGTANVYRSVGPGPAVVVLALDALKAFVPAAVLRASGGSDAAVAAAGAAAIVAHVTMVGGQGVAAGLGAGLAMDAPAALAGAATAGAGAGLGGSGQGVLAAMGVFMAVHCARRRSVALIRHPGLIVAILLAARLRGRPGAGLPSSARITLNRLVMDRDG